MLKRYALYIVLALIAVACSKDKYETRPKIEIKSVNGTEFPPSVPISIVLKYTDKEGDLSGGTLKYYRNRLNIVWPPSNKLEDSVVKVIPEFPKAMDGELELIIPAGRLNENPDHNDTVAYKIVVTDAAGNASDTIITPTFIDITP